jgi:hypothetical protein
VAKLWKEGSKPLYKWELFYKKSKGKVVRMNWKIMVLMIMAVGLFLVGCSSDQPPTGYYTYGQQGGQQQQQYVGGGCGLAGVEGDAPAIVGAAAA